MVRKPLHERLDAASRLMLLTGGKNLADLVQWLADNVKGSERVVFTQWLENWWYVEVHAIVEGQKTQLCGFTVNVTADKIMWSNDTEFTSCGGNCFQRSERWRRLVLKRYPFVTDKEMYDYRKTSGVRAKAVA